MKDDGPTGLQSATELPIRAIRSMYGNSPLLQKPANRLIPCRPELDACDRLDGTKTAGTSFRDDQPVADMGCHDQNGGTLAHHLPKLSRIFPLDPELSSSESGKRVIHPLCMTPDCLAGQSGIPGRVSGKQTTQGCPVSPRARRPEEIGSLQPIEDRGSKPIRQASENPGGHRKHVRGTFAHRIDMRIEMRPRDKGDLRTYPGFADRRREGNALGFVHSEPEPTT